MTRTPLASFLDLVLFHADDHDGWTDLLDTMATSDDSAGRLADELRALRAAMDEDGVVSEIDAGACGFTHRDLLRLLDAGILAQVDEIDGGFRVRFAGLETLALGMVA